MEYGLREQIDAINTALRASLNPCFNGIWSASSAVICTAVSQQQVLILVLMEYGLRGTSITRIDSNRLIVLILVLMEYGLRGSNL